MFQTNTIAKICLARMEARYPKDLRGKQTTLLLKSYADSIQVGLSESLRQSNVTTGSISGGTSAPSGPLVGGVCVFSGGSLAMRDPNIARHYKQPTYPSIVVDNVTYTGKYTKWMRALTKVLSSELDFVLQRFTQGFNVTTTAQGGVCAWIPGSPPSSGPWVGGTIVPISMATSSNIGILASLKDNVIASARRTIVRESLGDNQYEVPLYNTKARGHTIIDALALGIQDGLLDIFQATMLHDPTNQGASGTAFPGGAVSGAITNVKLLVD